MVEARDYWVLVHVRTGAILGNVLHPSLDMATKNKQEGLSSVSRPDYRICRASVILHPLTEPKLDAATEKGH